MPYNSPPLQLSSDMQSSSIITVISFRSFEGQKTKATPSGMPCLRPCSPPRLQVATAAPSWHTQFPAWCWAALRLHTRCSVTHVLTTHTPWQHCSTSMSSFSSQRTTSGCCAECCCASMFPWGHFSGSYPPAVAFVGPRGDFPQPSETLQ